MMKNRIVTLALSIILVTTLNISAEEVKGNPEEVQSGNVLETVNEPIESTLDEESAEMNLPEFSKEKLSPTQYKKPISKKSIAKKFILAMLGVAFSSFIIFFGLSLYNKIRDGVVTSKAEYKYDEPTLDSPDGIISAIRSFLERTNWK